MSLLTTCLSMAEEMQGLFKNHELGWEFDAGQDKLIMDIFAKHRLAVIPFTSFLVAFQMAVNNVKDGNVKSVCFAFEFGHMLYHVYEVLGEAEGKSACKH